MGGFFPIVKVLSLKCSSTWDHLVFFFFLFYCDHNLFPFCANWSPVKQGLKDIKSAILGTSLRKFFLIRLSAMELHLDFKSNSVNSRFCEWSLKVARTPGATLLFPSSSLKVDRLMWWLGTLKMSIQWFQKDEALLFLTFVRFDWSPWPSVILSYS